MVLNLIESLGLQARVSFMSGNNYCIRKIERNVFYSNIKVLRNVTSLFGRIQEGSPKGEVVTLL